MEHGNDCSCNLGLLDHPVQRRPGHEGFLGVRC